MIVRFPVMSLRWDFRFSLGSDGVEPDAIFWIGLVGHDEVRAIPRDARPVLIARPWRQIDLRADCSGGSNDATEQIILDAAGDLLRLNEQRCIAARGQTDLEDAVTSGSRERSVNLELGRRRPARMPPPSSWPWPQLHICMRRRKEECSRKSLPMESSLTQSQFELLPASISIKACVEISDRLKVHFAVCSDQDGERALVSAREPSVM